MGAARRQEGNPLADENRNDMDVELVDLAGVEEGGDQPSATHHPDLFAGSRTQTLGKRLYRLRYECYAWRRSSRRLPREHVVGDLRVEQALGLTALLVVAQHP